MKLKVDGFEHALAGWQGSYIKEVQLRRLKALKAVGADLNQLEIGAYGLIEHPALEDDGSSEVYVNFS